MTSDINLKSMMLALTVAWAGIHMAHAVAQRDLPIPAGAVLLNPKP